jgi:hypothetical protein
LLAVPRSHFYELVAQLGAERHADIERMAQTPL